MKVSDFYYELPQELIAQHPLEKRDTSRMMVVDKNDKTIKNKIFSDITDYLNEGDCLVLNNTRVIPARLYGQKEGTGGKIEFVLIKSIDKDIWEVILKPGRKAKVGTCFIFGDGKLKAKILKIVEQGNRIVRFEYEGVFENILDECGVVPLPPYITEKLEDPERYQTVYSKIKGSAAAPTAGLHFTPELLESLKSKGVNIATVTLHVGLGTFRPVKAENIEDHKMHKEYYTIDEENAKIINNTKQNGKRVIGVGTTSCRVLETVGKEDGMVETGQGETGIFIYPGYRFKVVDALITNFHLPESTLLMLVSALAGKELIIEAYQKAVKEKYRFFSFGDAMLIK